MRGRCRFRISGPYEAFGVWMACLSLVMDVVRGVFVSIGDTSGGAVVGEGGDDRNGGGLLVTVVVMLARIVIVIMVVVCAAMRTLAGKA